MKKRVGCSSTQALDPAAGCLGGAGARGSPRCGIHPTATQIGPTGTGSSSADTASIRCRAGASRNVPMPTEPTEIRKWLLNVGWQVGFAVALAAAFAVGSGGTPAAFFRYVAAIGGLTSVLQAIVAVGRGRALGVVFLNGTKRSLSARSPRVRT